LTCEEGRGDALLQQLYRLLDLTRERHGVPPQPLAWFRNLVDCLGDALCIRVASRQGEPIAAILTLAHGDRLVYKYGGSDARLHALGGVPFLFWHTIQDAKRRGAVELDLGRSDEDNTGLIAFKDHLGARRSPLSYWRSPVSAVGGADGRSAALARRALGWLPAPMRRAAGRFLYRHVG
jgi:lipid II:glycine glycyltransferase (peptidoglycan interpeptide bridge formation enzyme)